MDLYRNKIWIQRQSEEEKLQVMKDLSVKTHTLCVQKLQLIPLLPAGVLANWICKKLRICNNQHMNDTINRVWKGLSDDAKKKLYNSSLCDVAKVEKQKSVIDSEILKLRTEFSKLSLTFNCPSKDQEFLEYFEGDAIVTSENSFKCHEIGCKKMFSNRRNLNKDERIQHPWKIPSPVPVPVPEPVPVPVPVPVPAVSPTPKVPFAPPQFGMLKRAGTTLIDGPAKVVKSNQNQQPMIYGQCPTNHFEFPADTHYRANLAYQTKFGKDRPNGHNSVLLCDCPDMRPAVRNVVTHDASHIWNRGADYFWCSRKAIKKVGQSIRDLTPSQQAEYRKNCNFFVFQFPPNTEKPN